MSNLLVNASYTSGYWKASATVGGYNFPTLGRVDSINLQQLLGQNGGAACANVELLHARCRSGSSHTRRPIRM